MCIDANCEEGNVFDNGQIKILNSLIIWDVHQKELDMMRLRYNEENFEVAKDCN